MKRKLMLLIGLLVILSLACSAISLGSNDGPEDNDNPDTAVTVEVIPEENDDNPDPAQPPSTDEQDAPTVEEIDELVDDIDEELTFDTGGLEQLTSYRATMSYQLTRDDNTVETFAVEQAATRDPQAQRFVMSSTEGDIEYILIEDQMWIRFGEEWIQGSSSEMEEDDFDSFLSTGDDWISNVGDDDYEYLGKETINGIQTRHYRVTESVGWLGLLDETDADGEVEKGTANVWIADESGLPAFLVRYEVEIEGTIDGEAGTLTLSQNVTEINQPIVIEPPEGVALGGLPEGVPVYPGAAELTSFGTMTTFTVSDDDLATVATFYEEALSGAGWVQGGDSMTMEGMASSTWTKDAEQLTLTITADEDGLLTVLVMIGE